VETWKLDRKNVELEVQAVGLPPYPGTSRVRVAGLIRPASSGFTKKVPTIEYLRGDALQPRKEGKKVVAHVVNDQTPRWGGSGFASFLKKKWPDVQEDFKIWAEANKNDFRLGAIRVSTHDPGISVISMVAQRGYGPSEHPRIRYTALEKCLEKLADYAIEEGRSIHMPKIGTGYGGGNWDVIEELIDRKICSRGLPVLIYQLPR
jgi:O-acetyl-ADP-ribose deacetylase (regulator of RNase III)